MTYIDAFDDRCTAALMNACNGFAIDELAPAAGTLLAQCAAHGQNDLRSALAAFDRYVDAARIELEMNFAKVERRKPQ